MQVLRWRGAVLQPQIQDHQRPAIGPLHIMQAGVPPHRPWQPGVLEHQAAALGNDVVVVNHNDRARLIHIDLLITTHDSTTKPADAAGQHQQTD